MPEEFPHFIEKSGYQLIELKIHEAASFHQLPKFLHKDPFDRMLIWQAIQNRFSFMSVDKGLKSYQKLGLKMV